MPQWLDARTLAPEAIEAAAERLAAGALVAFPTETVYGLGARADRSDAVAQIFAAKGRPADHPLIVHVAEAGDALAFAAEVPPVAQRLMAAFWPGPLTLILPRRAGQAEAAAGGQDSVGLRCPAHPAAHALLLAARRLGVPGVAGPSANRFGRVSPTRAAHVMDEFPERDDLCVLDGGDCAVGIESTIVDCSRGHPVLLRPGQLTVAALSAAAGTPVRARDAAAPRAPGTLASHYAPQARVVLFDGPWTAPRAAVVPPQDSNSLGVYSRSPSAPGGAAGVRWRVMPSDPDAVAHELFAVLREFDTLGVSEIHVEQPPAGEAWDGVRDRLRRAATP